MFPTCATPAMLAMHALNGLPPVEPLPVYAEPATCIEPSQLARQEQVSGTFDQTRQTDHFLLAWDSSNAVLDAAMVEVVADALETSWTSMVDEHGWRAPDQTESCLVTVLMGDLTGSSSGTGGWTNVNAEGGVPYMVLNTDWFSDGSDWVESLVAHEFNHASQFAYNVFWDESDWWYWESTAEWAFELPYPDANTWTYSLWSYLDAPYLALDSDTGFVNYGHFTFNVYLAEQVDPAAPRLVWEAASSDTPVDTATTDALGVPFDDLVTGWTAHVAAFDVEEWALWEQVLVDFDTDPYNKHVRSYPAVGEVDGKQAPQRRGQNFLHFAGHAPAGVFFQFQGEAEANGNDTRWAVTLSTRATDGTVTHEVYDTVEGSVDVSIPALGGLVSDAYVGVVPLGEVGKGGVAWSWRADESDKVPVDEATACGCDGGAAPAGALAVAASALFARRRGRATPR